MNVRAEASQNHFKVILVFTLHAGMADEELRRSRGEGSFPRRLARQPGFVGMELAKIDEEHTMSVQTWDSPGSWWSALEAVKGSSPGDDEPILASREFYAGTVVETLAGDRRDRLA